MNPEVLFHCLAATGLVTEELWRLQLVSRECRDLYRRYVVYRNPAGRGLQIKEGLVGAQRLSQEKTVALLKTYLQYTYSKGITYMTPMLAPLSKMQMMKLIQKNKYCQLTPEQFRIICWPHGAYMCWLYEIKRGLDPTLSDSRGRWGYWSDIDTWARRVVQWNVKRANRYFQILGRIPLYLNHLVVIVMGIHLQLDHNGSRGTLREDVRMILGFSAFRGRHRRKARETVYQQALEWHKRIMKTWKEVRYDGVSFQMKYYNHLSYLEMHAIVPLIYSSRFTHVVEQTII